MVEEWFRVSGSGHGTQRIKNIGDIKVCTNFKMLQVKVPIIFSACRVFRHAGLDVTVLTFLAALECWSFGYAGI